MSSKPIDPLVARAMRKRIEDGCSQRSAASAVGVAFSAWARWERGEGVPDRESSERLSRWLKGKVALMPRVTGRGDGWPEEVENRLSRLEEKAGF